MRRARSSMIVFVIWYAFLTSVYAQQTEVPVACDEGVISEPVDLSYASHTMNCEVNLVTDLDQFRIQIFSGDLVRIILSSSGKFDPRVEIRDPMGGVIEDQFCEDGFFEEPCSIMIDLPLEVTGTYLIAVSDNGADETGEYTLQVERVPPVDEPTLMSYDLELSDQINPRTDVDFVTFKGFAATQIRVSMSSSGKFDPRVEIRDPMGGVIEDQFCEDGFFEEPCSIMIDLPLEVTGTYLIAVSDNGADETGNYEINLQCLFGRCEEAFTIFPSSGTLAMTFGFDLGLIVDMPDHTASVINVDLNGTNITEEITDCFVMGTLVSGGQVFRCPNFSQRLDLGTHTLSVDIRLNDESVLTQKVIWEILDNTEP